MAGPKISILNMSSQSTDFNNLDALLLDNQSKANPFALNLKLKKELLQEISEHSREEIEDSPKIREIK
jgi:hypothetical protein